jgi:hypothetical protein
LRRCSVVALLAALALAPAASAADPGAVYSDYAQDHVLSCNHSRADLRAALTDATLNQYGDPYTLIGLQRAIRKQLAGGCGNTPSTTALTGTERGGTGSVGNVALAVGSAFALLALGAAGWAARRAVLGRG